MSRCNVVMLDNLDSFTYNLVDEFQCLGFAPIVYRNTLSAQFIIAKMHELTRENGKPVLLVLSPGPGTPTDAGCLMALIAQAAGQFPILGICLGHQALVQHYGGTISTAPEIVHGKASAIEHSGTGPFANLVQPLPVARYHSLFASTVPLQLDVIAHYQQLPMAICHQTHPVLGLQFHPESILTTFGSTLLAQSIHYLLHVYTAQGAST
jgi:anthranilate synthase component II